MLPFDETFDNLQWRPSRWMSDVRSYISPFALTQVCLVGSHNAATSAIDRHSRFGRDAPGLLKKHGCCACLVKFLGRKICAPWSRCQSQTILDQLHSGVRYFDLRISPRIGHTGEFYTTHGQLSEPLCRVMHDIENFFQTDGCGDEIIVLDFQHLFGMCSEGITCFINEIHKLSDRLIPAGVPLSTPLHVLWEMSSRQRIFLVVNYNLEHPAVRSRRTSITSVWLNQSSLPKLLFSLEQLTHRDIKENTLKGRSSQVPDKLYVTQAILTPTPKTIARGLFSFSQKQKSVLGLSEKCNSNILEWFCSLNAHSKVNNESVTLPQGVNVHSNILMLDFVEKGRCRVAGESDEVDAVAACVRLNLLRSARMRCAPSACHEALATDGNTTLPPII